MVLIEAKTQVKQENEQVTIQTREPVGQANDGSQIFLKKTITIKNDKALQKIMESTKGVLTKIKETLLNIKQGVDFSNLKSPAKRAQAHIKECWYFMSQNEVEKARQSYQSLRDAYEKMNEGPTKTEVYYEVYDIYTRLAEVKA